MPEVKSVRDADVVGKRVLVRVVLNVPLVNGAVADDTRLRAVVPTIELLQKKGAKEITLMGYVGRPAGQVVEELRVAPIAAKLAELTDMSNVFVMENLRFDPREEANDPTFAQELASHGDMFVSDAFADSHRAYASTVGVAQLLPSFAGLQLEKEIQNLTAALTPPKGSIAVIGGAKFETKQPLIEKLLATYDKVLLGGALGNDVLKARGFPIGASLVSSMPVPTTIAADERVVVATDVVVRNISQNAERTTVETDIQAEEKIIDIGPLTATEWGKVVASAPFVLWNGPLGIYEEGFTDGTDIVAEALTKSGTRAVIGGGDTIAAVSKLQFNQEDVFLSTGGGAMLEFLVQGTLPAIDALKH
jgi:phosphoglycerate kinase